MYSRSRVARLADRGARLRIVKDKCPVGIEGAILRPSRSSFVRSGFTEQLLSPDVGPSWVRLVLGQELRPTHVAVAIRMRLESVFRHERPWSIERVLWGQVGV